MSILIDMEMPKTCGYCALCTWISDGKRWFCPVKGKRFDAAYKEKQDDCPLKEVIRCGECKHYQGNHDAPGCAPCSLRGLGEVMWDDFCKRGERWDG